MRIKIFYILILSVGVFNFANAQVVDDEYLLRKYDRAAIERYRNDPSFKETPESQPPPPPPPTSSERNNQPQTSREKGTGSNNKNQQDRNTVYDRSANDPARRIEPNRTEPEPEQAPNRQSTSSPSTPSDGLSLSWAWVIIIAVLLFVVAAYFMGLKPSSFKKKKGEVLKTDPSNEAFEHQHIDEIKFETELEKAIREGNYRLAIRILYLESLKMLNDRRMIKWSRNKTNWDYVHEINRDSLKTDFKKVNLFFDFVWYGNATVNKAAFEAMQEKIKLFKNNINSKVE